MKKLLLCLMLVCSTSFAAVPNQRDLVMAVYAAGLFNGVYQMVGEDAQVRIYFDTSDLYMDINGRVLANARIDHIDGANNTVLISHDLRGGRAVTQMERMTDGVLWTLEDGSQAGLVPVRALNMQDTMSLMCKSKTGAELVAFKKAALESTGSKCSSE